MSLENLFLLVIKFLLHVLASKDQCLHQAIQGEGAHADAIDSGEQGKSTEKGRERERETMVEHIY